MHTEHTCIFKSQTKEDIGMFSNLDYTACIKFFFKKDTKSHPQPSPAPPPTLRVSYFRYAENEIFGC